MSLAYLDTQIAAWLCAGSTHRLSRDAKREIERSDLLISPMAVLELHYLHVRKRTKADAMPAYLYLHTAFGVQMCDLPFAAVMREALQVTWTEDPFDRLIVAQAMANGEARLITADSVILDNYARAL